MIIGEIKGKNSFPLGKWNDMVIKVSVTNYSSKLSTAYLDAVIDSGSLYSYISEEIWSGLKCCENGRINHKTFDGIDQVKPYTLICMDIEGYKGTICYHFAQMPTTKDYQIVLGTNFLKSCNLYYYGKEKKFDLEFIANNGRS